jgi:hypothetical protein
MPAARATVWKVTGVLAAARSRSLDGTLWGGLAALSGGLDKEAGVVRTHRRSPAGLVGLPQTR